MALRSSLLTLPVLLTAFAFACAAGPSDGLGPAAAPSSTPAPGPALVDTSGGLEAAGKALAGLLSNRYPSYWSGRMAVGWDTREAWLEPLGDGFAAASHNAILLADMGAVAHTEDQAFIQLDPSSFSGLLWVSPQVTPGGVLTALNLSLTSTQGRPVERLFVECRPPLPLRPAGEAAGTTKPALWASLPGVPRALHCSRDGRLWVALPDALERLGDGGKTVQSWPLDASASPVGRAVLGSGEESASSSEVGFFDLGRGAGWWFRRQPSGSYDRAEALAGYPLAERLQRFFSAPFDAAGGSFQLQDFQGKALASVVDMCRFAGPRGTLFGLLGGDGSLSVLDGDRLTVLPGPSLEPVAALAGSGSLLFDATAEAPYRVRAHALTPSKEWQTVWTSPPLGAPVTSLCVGALGGRPQVIAGTREPSGGAVYTLDCPLLGD